jgi:hypothetical protein
MSEERIMTAEEFFGGIESDRGMASMSTSRKRKGRAKKTFADIKARMVMRIYGVTREKAEKIISERAASAGTESGVNSAGAARVRERFLDPDDLLAD